MKLNFFKFKFTKNFEKRSNLIAKVLRNLIKRFQYLTPGRENRVCLPFNKVAKILKQHFDLLQNVFYTKSMNKC